MANEHEARARAIKAYKLSRVALRLLDEPGVTVSSLRDADEDVRHRVADLAGTHNPSPETWNLVCSMLATERGEDA